MNIQLIDGEFSQTDALSIISDMIQVKIKYHEGRIGKHSNEEDVKYIESKIKRLQNNLHELRTHFSNANNKLKINAAINIG